MDQPANLTSTDLSLLGNIHSEFQIVYIKTNLLFKNRQPLNVGSHNKSEVLNIIFLQCEM